MLCPKCGEEMPQQEQCPHCGAVIPEEPVQTIPEEVTEASVEEELEETAEIETEAAEAEETAKTEEAPELSEELPAASEEAPEQPRKKSRVGILLGVVIGLLVVVVVCLSLALKTVIGGGSLPNVSQMITDWKTERADAKFDPNAVAIRVTDTSGAAVAELSNEKLAFYYWSEYFYFVNTNSYVFDPSMRLDEQVYSSETDSETGTTTVTTWHQYFLQSACYSINQTEALVAEAESVGFTMTEDYQAMYDEILGSLADNALSAGFTDADGNGDTLAYIQDSYGPNVTMEGFKDYLYDSYYASSYSDSIYLGFEYDDDQLSEYFDANAETYAGYNIEKLDIPNVNVRHILVEPETSEDGTISEEAWEAAAEEAERIYQEWQDGDATEESFGVLAETYTADPGSSSTGGLYENVYPGQMVTAFNDWCFEEGRQAGDTAIVKTDFGYHIMYFSSYTEDYYWKDVAESDLRYEDFATRLEDLTGRYITSVTEEEDIQYPDAVKLIMESYSAQ